MVQQSSNLRIHQLQLGPMDNFVYLLADTETGEVVAIDPAWDAGEVLEAIDRNGYTLTAIWLTHGHDDHTNIVPELVRKRPAPVYLSRLMPAAWRPDVEPIFEFDDGDRLSVGSIDFQVLHTPGHSPDGSCFYHPGHLIAGDTVFIDGCGRCDLADSDVDAMYASLQRVMALPDETVVYPGHDYGSTKTDTIGGQKRTNRFMLAGSHEAFVRERMG